MKFATRIILVFLAMIECSTGVPRNYRIDIRNKRLMSRFSRLIDGYQGFVSIQDEAGTYLCDGLLLDTDFVLTTAMCIIDYSADQLKVIYQDTANQLEIGTANLITKQVEQVLVHPNFDPETWNHNIGMLRVEVLSTELETYYVPTIFESPKADSVCNLIGLSQNSSATLLMCQVKIVDNRFCNETIFSGNLGADRICAFTVNAKDLCSKEKGSALICGGDLSGVLSYDTRCPNQANLGVFTDISKYNEWIDEAFRSIDPQTQLINDQSLDTTTELPATTATTLITDMPEIISTHYLPPYAADTSTNAPTVIHYHIHYHIYNIQCTHNCTREAIIKSLE